jgi:hypothetical protein
MAKAPGISIRRGTRNYQSFDDVFKAFAKETDYILEQMGELTELFDPIGQYILDNLDASFQSGAMADGKHRPHGIQPGRRAKQAAKARGAGNDEPLYRSGKMANSIGIKQGPTSKTYGRNRQVRRLIIGGSGDGYDRLKEQMEGGTWSIPVRRVESETGEGFHFLDPERLPGSTMSGEEMYPGKWDEISSLPEGTYEMAFPYTDIFALYDSDVAFIERTVRDFVGKLADEKFGIK